MSAIDELLSDPARRQTLVRDANDVLEAEVRDKRGLTGVAVKGGFKIVKGLKPGIIPGTIDALLDEFVKACEPFVEQAKHSGKDLKAHFVDQGSSVADALLAITDKRAQRNSNRTLVGAYNKLRPKGKAHVVAAMPRVGELIGKHLG